MYSRPQHTHDPYWTRIRHKIRIQKRIIVVMLVQEGLCVVLTRGDSKRIQRKVKKSNSFAITIRILMRIHC